MTFSPGRIERARRTIADLEGDGLAWDCPLCNKERSHYLGCPLFEGEIDEENLARFLFDESNAGSDGPRIMEMMERMARGILEKLTISTRKKTSASSGEQGQTDE